ncbi:MAG TPA: hypothetical protein VM369_06645 [Candidatus Binatia bacterium]|nr:hypothetical protein [Candidatus Binatia bacterium]
MTDRPTALGTEERPPRGANLSRVVSAVQIAVALAGIVFGGDTLLHPLYTDRQIFGSLADTWVVEALLTLKILGVAAVSLALSALLAWRGRGRRLAAMAIVLTVIAAALTIYNHAVLTHRATELTGQKFVAFYGLLPF